VIIVTFSLGSADPLQLAKCAAEFGGCVFVVDPSDSEAVALVGLLEQLGLVIVSDNAKSIESTLRNEGIKPRGVVTFAELGVEMAMALAHNYQLPLLAQGEPARLIDKFVQRTALNKEFGSDGTPIALIGDGVPSDFNFPAFVKPRRGAGSRNTIMVTERDNLEETLSMLGADEDYVIEHALIGTQGQLDSWLADYVSVESFVQDSIIHTIGITGRLPLASPARETGLIFPISAAQPLENKLIDTTNRAIRALGIENGVVHTELKLCEGGPKIIEVNPRVGGYMARLMPWAIGLNPVSLAMRLACGITVNADIVPGEPRQYSAKLYIQAPASAVELVRDPPIDEIRALSGVRQVDQHVKIGDFLDWRTGSSGRILDVYVVRPTLDEVGVSVRLVNELVNRASIYREI
jgi:hypothetical protein